MVLGVPILRHFKVFCIHSPVANTIDHDQMVHSLASELGLHFQPGRVAQSVGYLTRKSGVLGSIPGLATYFRFSFRFSKKGSCQLLAKVCARSTG